MKDSTIELGLRIIEPIERIIAKYSPHGSDTFIDPSEYPWTRELEENWTDIREELDKVLAFRNDLPNFQDISEDQKSITTDNKWKTFFLFGYGFEAKKNTKMCPKTKELLKKIPGMKTAMFSILDGGKHIPHHRGPFKGVLRYHMGLVVPEPEKCKIRVGNDFAHWYEGKSMIFDDTHDHEVWNDSEKQRVVLFVDFVRPMPFPLSAFNRFLLFLIGISPFIQDAKKNQTKWDARLEKAINRRAEQTANVGK